MVFWHWSIQELFKNSNQQHLLCQLMGIIPFGWKNSTTVFQSSDWSTMIFSSLFGNPKAILITYIYLYYYSKAYRIAWVKRIWTPFSSLNPFFPRTIMWRLYLQSRRNTSLPRPSKNPQRMVQVLNSWAETPSLWVQTEGQTWAQDPGDPGPPPGWFSCWSCHDFDVFQLFFL